FHAVFWKQSALDFRPFQARFDRCAAGKGTFGIDKDLFPPRFGGHVSAILLFPNDQRRNADMSGM
ncbi:MAG: hypothetical protein AAGK57_13200, partial [Pseudomonadota bacterium]